MSPPSCPRSESRQVRRQRERLEGKGQRVPQFGPITFNGRTFTADEVRFDYEVMLQEVSIARRARQAFDESGNPAHLEDAIREIAALPDRPLSNASLTIAILTAKLQRAYETRERAG